MRFRVVIAETAAREIEQQYEWLAERSEAAAERWRNSLLAAIDSLEQHPERCGAAPEADRHEGLRQLLHGKRRHVHRILFEVRGRIVVILRVRHGSRDLLGPGEI